MQDVNARNDGISKYPLSIPVDTMCLAFHPLSNDSLLIEKGTKVFWLELNRYFISFDATLRESHVTESCEIVYKEIEKCSYVSESNCTIS